MGVIVALVAAFVWGSGDFVGGRATRGRDSYQVLALVSLSGLAVLLLCAWVRGEAWPTGVAIAWSAAAGVAGGFGLAALYQGLAISEAAVVAPTAAVVGVILPVVTGAALVGLPTPTQVTGMLAGTAGIWLVARGSSAASGGPPQGLGLGLLAGVGFGGYFVFMAQVPAGAVFTPLAVAKSVATVLGVIVVAARRLPLLLPHANPWALLAGVLDAAGNVFYLVAAHLTRLDFAALVSSMAPAVTVVLAGVISRQRTAPRQWLGVGLCVVGVALIAA
jgi:drug/metabolite transporter (DMT)-like permease